MTIVAERTFVPPGPGSWFLDPTHWTRPVTRFHAEIFPDAFQRGFGESLRRYGSLLEYLEAGFVNGFPYYCARPVGAPRMLTRPPAAVRRAPNAAASAPLRPGKERHSCPGSASISRARPS